MTTAGSFNMTMSDLSKPGSFLNKFSRTMRSPVTAERETTNWLNSSFPVLCILLDKALAASCNFESDFPESAQITLLKDLFECVASMNNLTIPGGTLGSVDIPLYAVADKFQSSTLYNSVIVQNNFNAPKLSSPTELELLNLPGKLSEIPELGVLDSSLVPEFCHVEYHKHTNGTRSDGLLQICNGPKSKVYRRLDNKVREMDKIIINPESIISSDVMETSCKLELPGPFSFPVGVKEVSFGSNRHVMGVLGLFMLMIDTIYATQSVSYVNFNGVPTPLEFTQNIVKVVSLMKAGFPEVFYELQKLLMYSQVSLILKKAPFKWNKCMVHVLEDLLVHPLHYVSEETIEFKLLTMIVRKRAKVLFKIFSPEEKLIFNSYKHRSVLLSNFSTIYLDEVRSFLKTSAMNCKLSHRVKNIRYKVKDKLFESFLRDLFRSYC